MTHEAVLLLVLVTSGMFAVAILIWFERKSRQVAGAAPVPATDKPPTEVATDEGVYESRSTLLSPAERSFFGVLERAVNGDYRVFAKVRVADIVRPRPTDSRREWQSAHNRITGKHLDFVLCEPGGLELAGAVELDDQSHDTLERGVRDAFVDDVFRDAGIPLIRFPAKAAYSVGSVRDEITKALRGPAATETMGGGASDQGLCPTDAQRWVDHADKQRGFTAVVR